MKTAVGIAFAAAFATVVPLSAQEVKQTLSLDEAIAVTLTENPAMKAAEFEEKAAMQERRAAIGLRMPLRRGTVVVFDTCQPHAVIPRHSNRFDAADFATGQSDTQLFLTWELPIENPHVAHALQVRFDTDPAIASRLAEEQLWRNGAPAEVCPDSGQWRSQPICPEFVEELS